MCLCLHKDTTSTFVGIRVLRVKLIYSLNGTVSNRLESVILNDDV